MLPVGVNGCGNCSNCTRAEEQARVKAAQEAARKSHQINTGDASHLCTAGSIHPECSFNKSDHEPLAWSLAPTDILDQSNSPLFTLLPREIRGMIYDYALTDTTSYPVDRDRPENPNPFARFDRVAGYSRNRAGNDLYPSDIAFALLYTCKAVYLETYATPLRINPYITGELSTQKKRKHELLAWQLAEIRSLDITLPQDGLENGALRNYLAECWNAESRIQGCYIVPRTAICPSDKTQHEMLEYSNDNNNIFIPAPNDSPNKKRPTPLIDVLNSTSPPYASPYLCTHTLLTPRLQPIHHLTLRLTHTDWRTWGNAPDKNPTQHLHLDPTFGLHASGHASHSAMQRRASERLAHPHPRTRARPLHPESWGAHIASLLPRLETLTFVLEMWKVKEEQLESVVQCAKTWEFCACCEVGGQGGEEKWTSLVWDGEVVEKRWTRGLRGLRLHKDASWADRCNEFEVRVMRYVRKRVEV